MILILLQKKKLQQNYFLDVLVEHCVLLRSKTYHPSVIVVRREFTQLRHCFLASLVLFLKVLTYDVWT